MKKQGLVILFFGLLAVNIAGVETGNQLLQYLSKPLLMPLLILFFMINTAVGSGALKKWILLALFFSWAGDVLLMFQDKIPDFFLFGLTAFLLAHVFYIVFFHSIRVREGIKGKIMLLLPVAVYYIGLMIWLSPYLGDMTMPVRIYGLIISFMFMLALHMLFIRNKQTSRLMVAGALLFVASDSILAINKFYMPFRFSGAAIMITYGLAQYFLVKGAARYIAGTRK
jgi:uncharacterized membrane protein YhhN